MTLEPFFTAKSVAIIGASRHKQHVGNVIMDNLVNGDYKGMVYPVNPKAKEVLGKKAYASVLDIYGKVDLAVVAVPAQFVIPVVEECGKKSIKYAIIVSAGFSEVGNTELQKKLKEVIEKNKINVIGPNCLGVIDIRSGMDTMFLPRDRIRRPGMGGLSIISQSGALGSTLIDLATLGSIGVNKFISYGNGVDVDVPELLEYLGEDDSTTVICMYVEGLKDGRAFLDVAQRVTKKKPIIVLKGGTTEAGGKAALSHTASLAGEASVYHGAFMQAGCIIADNFREFVDYVELFAKCPPEHGVGVKGKQVGIVTNSGGHGILVSDAMEKNNLTFAPFTGAVWKKVGKQLAPVVVHNPLDLLGDATAERYKLGLDACLADKDVDIVLLMCMPQTPMVKVDELLDVVQEAQKNATKPIVCVTSGSTFAEELKLKLEKIGLPCYYFPEEAVKSIAVFVRYYSKR